MTPQGTSDNPVQTEELARTENFSVWISTEQDGEVEFHLEMGGVTVHFYQEEWDEFIKIMKEVISLDGRR
jgi:hypothetical protein